MERTIKPHNNHHINANRFGRSGYLAHTINQIAGTKPSKEPLFW